MRRDTFLKSMAALAAAGALPLTARAAANVKMMIPANPGGGWDTTGRALGKALQEAKVADSVNYDNKGGAAGALGLAIAACLVDPMLGDMRLTPRSNADEPRVVNIKDIKEDFEKIKKVRLPLVDQFENDHEFMVDLMKKWVARLNSDEFDAKAKLKGPVTCLTCHATNPELAK